MKLSKKMTAKALAVCLAGTTAAVSIPTGCSYAAPGSGQEGRQEDIALELFVSQDGREGAEGTEDDPLPSLEAARDRIRQEGAAGDGTVVVNIREGVYRYLEEPFRLEEEDSGTEENPVIYRAYEDEKVELTGSIVLDGNLFKPVTDQETLDRLDEEVRDKVLVYNLKEENGIQEFAPLAKNGFGWPIEVPAPILTVNGTAQTVARYPDSGFMNIGTVDRKGFVPRDHQLNWDKSCPQCSKDFGNGERIECRYGEEHFLEQEGGIWTVNDRHLNDNFERWQKESDIWTGGYYFWDWADDVCAIESDSLVNIPDGGIKMTAKHPSRYGVGSGHKIYAYNLLCELDRPGEWYLERGSEELNRESGNLYLYPSEDIGESSIELTIQANPLVMMDGVSNVRWENVSFTKSSSSGIQMTNCDHVLVAGCDFSDLGQRAVFMGDPSKMDWWNMNTGADGGHDNTILSCDITRTGQGGIYLGGGDRYTLTPGNNRVVNCDISDFAVTKRTYAPAVEMVGCGNAAERNRMYDAPHTAILYNGNDMRIFGNDIYDVCYETSDAGAIYTGRRWTWRGNVIENNYIHDMKSNSGIGSAGVYVDDLACGSTITKNLFARMSGRTTLIGGGRDVVITNNIQLNDANTGSGIDYDNRGESYGKNHATAPDGECYAELKYLRSHETYDEDAWQAAYGDALSKLPLNDGGYCAEAAKPAGAVITGNMMAGVKDPYSGISSSVKNLGTVDRNETYAAGTDIGFTNPEGLDFTVKPGSLIEEKMGDEHFDVSQMGLYSDEYRTLETGKLDTPVLIVPADGSEQVEFANGLKLIWNQVKGADSYTVEVARDDKFQDVVSRISTEENHVMANGIEKSTEYYWRVTARENKIGGASAVSEVRLFTTSENEIAPFYEGFKDFSAWEALVEGGIRKGSPTNTKEKSHTGEYAYETDENMDVIEKRFPVPRNDAVSMWLYDDMQTSNGTTVVGNVTRDNGSGGYVWCGLGVYIRDGQLGDREHYAYRIGGTWFSSEVKRSLGWHKLTWDYSEPGICDMYIDDVMVATDPDAPYYDRIMLGDFWNLGGFPGDVSHMFFDDVYTGELDQELSDLQEELAVVLAITAPEELRMEHVDETLQMAPEVELDIDADIKLEEKLRFESLEPDVAAVDEHGLVTAVHEGRTIVRVSSVQNPVIRSESLVLVGDGLTRYHVNVKSGRIIKIGDTECDADTELVIPGELVTVEADEAEEDQGFLRWRTVPGNLQLSDGSSRVTSFKAPNGPAVLIAEYGNLASPSNARVVSAATPETWFAYAHSDSLNELLGDDEIVTEEDRTHLEKGWNVDVILEIGKKDAADTASPSDAIRKEAEKGEKTAFFAKTSLKKKVTTRGGDSRTVRLSTASNAVKISMEIPESFADKQSYRLLGWNAERAGIEEYPFTWGESGRVITFTGEANGIYGLLYRDTPEEPGKPEDPGKPDDPGDNGEPDTPEEPDKPSRPSGGGSSSSGSRRASGSGSTWKSDGKGWRYSRNGSFVTSAWEYIEWNGKKEWYYFGADGYMVSGWYQDQDGRWYYLNPGSDGTRGCMKTGWQLIAGKWYYFNEQSDGTKGAMLENTVTPDGFRVGADGAWIEALQ